MSIELLERFESEMELSLYREYRDIVRMFSWVVEIWSPMKEAGIENYKYIDWFRDHPVEDDLKLYRWNVDKLGGVAHIPWRAFDHPQLGRIEIGGWNRFHAFGNPPPAFLERELARFPRWLLWQSLTSPKTSARFAAKLLGMTL